MEPFNRRVVQFGVTAMVLVVVGSVNGGNTRGVALGTHGHIGAEVAQQPPECPFHHFQFPDRKEGQPTATDQLRDVGAITKVPEFHDCQRFFATAGSPPYGSLYAIFRVLNLHRIWARLDSLEDRAQSAKTVLSDSSAIIDSVGAAAWIAIQDSLTAAMRPRALLAAVSYTWGGSYDRLGISNGLNCLYLWDTHAPQAAMLAAGVRVDCPDTIFADVQSPRIKFLKVRRPTITGLDNSDVPVVARWEWDRERSVFYIGLWCGGAWCLVGDGAETPSAVYTTLAATSSSLDLPAAPWFVNAASELSSPPRRAKIKRRVTEVWGWFDQQHLAVPGVAGGQMQPGKVVGTAFPHPALAYYSEAAFTGTWVPTGFVSFSEPNAHYQSKLNFRSAPTTTTLDATRMTAIYTCRGVCRGVPDTLIDTCKWPTDDPMQPHPPTNPADRWWSKIVSASGTVYKCVIRRKHGDLKDDQGRTIEVPGTVRWRWMANDETIWKRCGSACCEDIP